LLKVEYLSQFILMKYCKFRHEESSKLNASDLSDQSKDHINVESNVRYEME